MDKSGGVHECVMVFKRDQLIYDIRNCAYIEGSVMETDSEHVRHTVQDVGEEGNIDRITRVLNLAVAKCRELLYPYTRLPINRTEANDILREPDVYTIVLSVPSDFSQTTFFLLENLIHEYLVCRALREWMSLTNPAKREAWGMKAEEAEQEIRMNLHGRINKFRRRPHPF